MTKKRRLPITALLVAVAALALVFGGAASRFLASHRSPDGETRGSDSDGIDLDGNLDENMAQEVSRGLD